MLFINTRPKERAQELTQYLQQAGIEVFELPLLSLQAKAWSLALQQLYAELTHVQVIVVVSPTAVDIGMEYLAKSQISLAQLHHVEWIAVGAKTAACLAQYGIKSSVPSVENSEGMLSLPCLQHLAADAKVAFWRGEGGRQFMMDQLQQRGIKIFNFVLYQRACPAETLALKQSLTAVLAQVDSYMVLISSEASWHYWQQLMQDDLHLAKAHYLVLGERVKHLMQAQQQLDIVLLDHLAPNRVLEKLL